MAFSVKITLRNITVSKINQRWLWQCTLPLLAQEFSLKNLSALWLSVKWIFTGNWPALSSSFTDSDHGPAQSKTISLLVFTDAGGLCHYTGTGASTYRSGAPSHREESCGLSELGPQKNFNRILNFNTWCTSKGKQILLVMILFFWSFVEKQQVLKGGSLCLQNPSTRTAFEEIISQPKT